MQHAKIYNSYLERNGVFYELSSGHALRGFTTHPESTRAFDAVPIINTHGPVKKAQRRVWTGRKARGHK